MYFWYVNDSKLTSLRTLLILAFALRLIGALVRYYVLVDVYHHVGDATTYFTSPAAYAG